MNLLRSLKNRTRSSKKSTGNYTGGELGIVHLAIMLTSVVLLVMGLVTARLGLVPACRWKLRYGQECPSCGLTTSFRELAEGNFVASINSHAGGICLALVLLVQLPLRMMWSRWSGNSIALDLAVHTVVLAGLYYAINLFKQLI